MINSLWAERSALPTFESLRHDVKTDVLIVGGGLAGLLCAYLLEAEGVDYLLIEADRICHGITRNTTAKITSQHGLIYDKLARAFDDDTARLYWQVNQAALERYRQLCREISCDFEERDNYVYSLDAPESLEAEWKTLQRLKIPADDVQHLPLPLATAGAVRFPAQAQFHPLKFAAAIARNLNIREQTKARSFAGNTVVTNGGTIRAEKIIVATHFPLLNKHGSFFLKMYQHRSYVLALEHAPDAGGMYVDASGEGLSFRNHAGLLLLGGGSHRTGKQGGAWTPAEVFAQKHYPHAEAVFRWAAQDCMTLDGVPYIGQYSRATPNLYVATGFNKWGMTSAMAAAMVLCDLVQGRENPYAAVFSPSRTILRPQLFANAFESTLNLLTPTRHRCPHLGCALKWNPQEHSWDCPCHGSRFDETGKLLDGPATGDHKNISR